VVETVDKKTVERNDGQWLEPVNAILYEKGRGSSLGPPSLRLRAVVPLRLAKAVITSGSDELLFVGSA